LRSVVGDDTALHCPNHVTIAGPNQIIIVAQGRLEVCDAAHRLEVMKKVSSDRLRCIDSNRLSQQRLS
jgi:hypothetical protein